MKLKAKMFDDISANKIVETNERKFMSPGDMAKIEAALAIGGVGDLTASKVTVEDVDSLFTSENKTVENILKEVFTSASNGKTQIATAITGMGVDALPTDTFTVLANKIKAIESGSTISKITKLNVVAPYKKDIILTKSKTIEDVTTSVLEYIVDAGIVKYKCDFDNTDSSNFNTNENVVFDGTMHCKTRFTRVITQAPLGSGTLYESESIIISDFNDITDIETSIVNSSMTITAAPKAQLVIANSDIDLTGIDSIDSIEWETTTLGSGRSLLLVSFDSGVTWKSYKDRLWVDVDVTNINDVKAKGMIRGTVGNLVRDTLEQIRNGSTVLKFAYLLEQVNVSDTANTDKISIKITMPGYSQIADKAKYSYSYDEITNTISYEFNTSGTYTINYVD